MRKIENLTQTMPMDSMPNTVVTTWLVQLQYISTYIYKVEDVHYDDVIMGTIASQITSLTSVYSTVYSGAGQSKHQSSASLAFVWGIHRGPVNSPHKWPVTRKMFPFDDVIMLWVRKLWSNHNNHVLNSRALHHIYVYKYIGYTIYIYTSLLFSLISGPLVLYSSEMTIDGGVVALTIFHSRHDDMETHSTPLVIHRSWVIQSQWQGTFDFSLLLA